MTIINSEVQSILQFCEVKDQSSDMKNSADEKMTRVASGIFNLSTLLKGVERRPFQKYCKDLENLGNVRIVAEKLRGLANQQILQSEDNFTRWERFIKRVVNLFKGHGFRTEGEWGIALANKIAGKDKLLQITYDLFRQKFIGVKPKVPDKKNVEALMKVINALPSDEIRYICKKIINSNEPRDIGENRDFLELDFFDQLNDSNKDIFIEEIPDMKAAWDMVVILHKGYKKPSDAFIEKLSKVVLKEMKEGVRSNRSTMQTMYAYAIGARQFKVFTEEGLFVLFDDFFRRVLGKMKSEGKTVDELLKALKIELPSH